MILSPLSGWVLQGYLGGSPLSVYQKREMPSNLKIMVFCYLCTLLGFSRGFLWFSVHSVAGFCRVLLGFSVFSVSEGANAVDFENFGFLLSLYISEVLPGVSL